MKTLEKLFCSLTLSIGLLSCGGEETVTPQVASPEFVTESGDMINLDGLWASDCATDLGMHLSETLTFSAESVEVDIKFFENAGCANQIGTEKVSIDFQAQDTFQVDLDGQTVLANKIVGIATQASNGESENFKQAFYIDDRNGTSKLYHGRFGSDGGNLDANGFPIELIPIPITKQQ